MSNISQNDGIKGINKEVSLLQDRLKISEKSLNQFQNGLRQIRRLRLKQGQKINLSKIKKKCKKHWETFGSKIEHFKKKDNLLKNGLVHVQKRKKLF